MRRALEKEDMVQRVELLMVIVSLWAQQPAATAAYVDVKVTDLKMMHFQQLAEP